MAPYIKDPEVDRLAEEVRAAYGLKTKTEAARIAFSKALDRLDGRAAMLMKLRALQDEVRRTRSPDPDFDEKAYTDMMWSD